MALNIENKVDLALYLKQNGYLAEQEKWEMKILHGGVSNRTVWVKKGDGTSWVFKQALEILRVSTDWYSHPRRIAQEALGLEWFAKFCPERSVPNLVFFDEDSYLLAMEAVQEPHGNLKELLLKGKMEAYYFQQLGALLGRIHSGGQQTRLETQRALQEYAFFESLRLEPYYLYTAQKLGEASLFMHNLCQITRKRRYTLVHGDYSPKNILIHQGQLILLDYEVAHFGDGTFDIGFLLTHLLSKANHLPRYRSPLIRGAKDFWENYMEKVQIGWTAEKEERAVAHTIACLLARVHGRSPLEYLSQSQKKSQTQLALSFIQQRPTSIFNLIERFQLNLSHA